MFVLIRPRAGDFRYSPAEFEVMREDIVCARELGANGVVLGILTPNARVDIERTAELVHAARPMRVTFHRAFDVAANLERALDDVIATGADRLLTSGGKASGLDGAEAIARLVERANGRIAILGSGGIRPGNVRRFLRATGVAEVHSSLRAKAATSSRSRAAERLLGLASHEPAAIVIREEDVRKFRAAADAR